MVPEETRQQVTDSSPKSQSKSDITQQDSPVMVCDSPMMPQSPDEDVSSRIPEISQPCVTLPEAASIELPLNVEDEYNNRTSHDFDAILGQVIPEELAFRFLDPSSTSSHQNITIAAESGHQVDHWASRTSPLGVQPPNISYHEPTVNESANSSLPYNPMGENLHIRLPSFIDIYDYELEMLNREQGSLQKAFEETMSELKAELDKKMAEIQRDYDKKSQEVDSEYINQAMNEEVYRSSIVMSSLLANGFMSKCTDRSVATGISSVRARSSQPSTQHMNSTPPPPPPPPPPPLSSVTTEAPIPDLSSPLSHSPRYNNMTQPRPISQEATVQSNTPMNSATLPQPSVISMEPRPPRSIMPQPRPLSQLATVQLNTPMNSTVLPQPSVTSVELRPLNSLRSIAPQPRPISQEAMVRSNSRHANSTAISRPSVTSEALPLHSPVNNTPQSRVPPLIPNHTPSSYSAAFTPPVQGGVRTMPPHLRSSRASNFASSAAASTTNGDPNSATTAASTTNLISLVQEQQQQLEEFNTDLVYLSDDEV